MAQRSYFDWLWAIGSGAALSLAFPRTQYFWLAWFALVPLIYLAISQRWRVRRAFAAGYIAGLAFFSISCYWIYAVLRNYGNISPPAAIGVLGAMVAELACFFGLFAAGLCWMEQRYRSRLRLPGGSDAGGVPRLTHQEHPGYRAALLMAPFLWVALELGRTYVVIGFPWDLLGYAVAPQIGIVQLTTITGIYGLSFLLLGFNALVVWLLLERSWRPVGALIALVGALGVANRLIPWPHPAGAMRAYLVQTNLPQFSEYPQDWKERFQPAVDELERLTVEAVPPGKEPALVIWPEVPAPFYLNHDPEFRARARRIAQRTRSYFLVGIVDWRKRADGKMAPYNSAAMLDPAGKVIAQYDKIHLVPFGEYVPVRKLFFFAERLTAEAGDFEPGRERTLAATHRGKVATFICYEAIFPAEVRQFVERGAEALVNISNDGWFGRTAAPDQHLNMARVRAVEGRRWLLRATNNGHTVIVDPYGRIVSRLLPDQRSVLIGSFDFVSRRTLYARFGDWWAWLCVLLALGGGVHALTKKERKT
ncbi:MAG TPA: apolipoprotein N-acyltransferase [Candidatus Acidoferrales bacterium]